MSVAPDIFNKQQLQNIVHRKPALTREDWDAIGKDKLLQSTVLDNIFKKYNDYQQLSQRQKKKDYFSPENLKKMQKEQLLE